MKVVHKAAMKKGKMKRIQRLASSNQNFSTNENDGIWNYKTNSFQHRKTETDTP
jgi:hypothetical protein